MVQVGGPTLRLVSRPTVAGWLLLLTLAAGGLAVPTAAYSSSPSRRTVIGHSVRGRPIVGLERGARRGSLTVLVVGCIHGNECAGTAVAHQLETVPLPPTVDLWIVPDLNPDGAAKGTRQNSDGVDLNRNFPWRWQHPAGYDNSGPRPLSEPESRAAYRLITRLHPAISIWFHQHLNLVDESGGSVALERRFAALIGVPLRRLVRYPGSVASWENRTMQGTSAFVVELPPGTLSPTRSRRIAQAVLELAR